MICEKFVIILDGEIVSFLMNVGFMVDLFFLLSLGVEGVGFFCIEF